MQKQKSIYITPEINRIILDNEISLILSTSTEEPPYPDDEVNLNIKIENPYGDNFA